MALLLETIAAHDDLRAQLDAAFGGQGSAVTIERILHNPGYTELRNHKKIDAFTYIPFTPGPELANAADFSKATLAQRIEAGYQEAIKQKIWEPDYIERARV